MGLGVHFMALSDRWATPAALYAGLNDEFKFTMDPCPLDGTIDGTAPLFSNWGGQRVFCNPPYGPGIRPFLERACDADVAVFLLPARTDVSWFHDIVLPFAKEIRFIRGRLYFGDNKGRAPFPSMIVVFKG